MVLALDTSVPLRHLHSVATFPGVAPYPSHHPPPPLNFFYRIAQLLYGFALCGFHLIFGLVALDSVAAIYLANENDRAEVRGFLSALARRAYEGDRSVLLLAHPPKSGSDYSGSTDWLAGVRALWTLRPRRGVIHAPRGAGHQLENEHLRLQVLPPIGTSSGRGRIHNRPQARRWWTWE